MYCTNCGIQLNEEDIFCGKCGTKVTSEKSWQTIQSLAPDSKSSEHTFNSTFQVTDQVFSDQKQQAQTSYKNKESIAYPHSNIKDSNAHTQPSKTAPHSEPFDPQFVWAFGIITLIIIVFFTMKPSDKYPAKAESLYEQKIQNPKIGTIEDKTLNSAENKVIEAKITKNGLIITQDLSVKKGQTEFETYKSKTYRAIGSRWYLALDKQSSLHYFGSVKIIFFVQANGVIRDVQIVNTEGSDALERISTQAIIDSIVFDPFPQTMKQKLGEGYWQSITFSITY